jgi:DNA polymerase III delta prime subunit
MKNPAFERILKNVAAKRPSHAYVFFGSQKEEMRDSARILAQSLNCACLREDGFPCGSCPDCRNTAQGTHPDLTWILPDEASMKIGQVRPLREIAQRKPMEGATKVIVLEDVHKLTDQAANSLLKLLEEPPQATVLILLTLKIEYLLPTILSRCWQASFQESAACLERETGLRILESLPASLLEAFRWAASLDKEKDKLAPTLESMEEIYRDRMVQAVSGEGGSWDPLACCEAQKLIREALWMLSRNVNTLLVLESLLLELRKIEGAGIKNRN